MYLSEVIRNQGMNGCTYCGMNAPGKAGYDTSYDREKYAKYFVILGSSEDDLKSLETKELIAYRDDLKRFKDEKICYKDFYQRYGAKPFIVDLNFECEANVNEKIDIIEDILMGRPSEDVEEVPRFVPKSQTPSTPTTPANPPSTLLPKPVPKSKNNDMLYIILLVLGGILVFKKK